MSKPKPTDLHVQCRLEKPTRAGGIKITWSWLPAKYAKKGKYLKLKDDDGNWEDGWLVVETWGKRPSADVLASEEFFKTHRDGPDRYRDADGNWVTRRDKATV